MKKVMTAYFYSEKCKLFVWAIHKLDIANYDNEYGTTFTLTSSGVWTFGPII